MLCAVSLGLLGTTSVQTPVPSPGQSFSEGRIQDGIGEKKPKGFQSEREEEGEKIAVRAYVVSMLSRWIPNIAHLIVPSL